MPFIPQSERKALAEGAPANTPGKRCYVFYKEYVDQWKAEPRWTTVDKIYRYHLGRRNAIKKVSPIVSARDLAWAVFFQNFVMPYEKEKEKLNGSI